jgi:hypothetical protein
MHEVNKPLAYIGLLGITTTRPGVCEKYASGD